MTPFDPSVGWVPSPHYGRGRGRFSVTTTLVHFSAGNGTIPWFANPRSYVSAHFVVQRNGRITQMVDLADAAWHAGVASAPYLGCPNANVNKFSVGIELENFGRLRKQGLRFSTETGLPAAPETPPVAVRGAPHAAGWWEPYPVLQLVALDRLLALLDAHGFVDAAHNLLGHSEVAPGRKVDPGPLFPWARYAQRRRSPQIITG